MPLQAWLALAMGIYLVAGIPMMQGTTWRAFAADIRELVRSLRG